jgi:hypothetical protein
VARLVPDEVCDVSCETSGAGDCNPYHCGSYMFFVPDIEVLIFSARMPLYDFEFAPYNLWSTDRPRVPSGLKIAPRQVHQPHRCRVQSVVWSSISKLGCVYGRL